MGSIGKFPPKPNFESTFAQHAVVFRYHAVIIACTHVGHLWEVAWEEDDGLNLVEYIGLAVFLVAFAIGVSVVANYVPPDERPKLTIKNRVRRFKPTAKEED